MRVITKFALFASALVAAMPEQAQRKSLADAINLDLSLPQLYIDMMGERAGQGFAGIKMLNGARANVIPDAKAISQHLARKWATTGDNPILADVSQRVESFWHSNMPEMDLGWTNLFQLIDLRGSNQDSFDITDTNAGIVWTQTKPGGVTKPRREISESTTPVPYLTYNAGLGLLDDWLRFQKFWRVEQAVAEFRATAWDKQAELHYGLFTALSSGVNQAFATNDTTTFNNAASGILRAVRTKGYAAGQSARFWILCAPEHLGRILLMLEATQGSGIVANQAGMQPLAYSVAGVIASTHVPAASTGYYLVLPGRKIQRGVWTDLAIEGQRDIYTRAQDWVGTQQFNAIIGDSDQVKRVLFA